MTTVDTRRARGQATQAALKRAAERLVAKRGIGNVSIREIVATAGQKNESALQYHFGNLAGLIQAIQRERSDEIRAMRQILLDELLAETSSPTLRQVCALMVQPVFELAKGDAGFRHFVRAFGHGPALTRTSALAIVTSHGAGGQSGERLNLLLRNLLPHLDADAYQRRMESAVRLCSASVYHHARQKSAFRGRDADLFYHHLLDALAGLLSADTSEQTRSFANKRHPR